MDLAPWFLFAHVLGAIIAFGPTFSFPIMGRLGALEPEHDNFATRLSGAISRIQVVPFAILQGVTGAGIIVTRGIDVLRVPWLMLAIGLYVIALGYAILVQTPTLRRVIALSSAAPEHGSPTDGQPPELEPLVRRIQTGGLFLTLAIVSIVFLMVVKPTF